MLHIERGEDVHPIIYNNPKNIKHWFNAQGKYVEMFEGIDGNLYAGTMDPEDWTPEIWKLYEAEGIRIGKPTPVENIKYPEKREEL